MSGLKRALRDWPRLLAVCIALALVVAPLAADAHMRSVSSGAHFNHVAAPATVHHHHASHADEKDIAADASDLGCCTTFCKVSAIIGGLPQASGTPPKAELEPACARLLHAVSPWRIERPPSRI